MTSTRGSALRSSRGAAVGVVGRRTAQLVAVAIIALPLAAGAVQPDEVLSDPALEARARALSAELRCLVCQNQSIDDSNAPLARDLRILVRERLKAGDTDAAAVSYLVNRYGDFVLLKPPFSVSTILLWLTPLMLLGVGGIMAARQLHAKPSPAATRAEAPLSTEESRRLDEILKRSD